MNLVDPYTSYFMQIVKIRLSFLKTAMFLVTNKVLVNTFYKDLSFYVKPQTILGRPVVFISSPTRRVCRQPTLFALLCSYIVLRQ